MPDEEIPQAPDAEIPPAPEPDVPPAPIRSTVRVPLEAEARVEFETFSGFLSEMAANLSLGGMFLRTRYLKPVGSELRFELRLADEQPLVAGRGEVAWIRWKDDGPRRRAGMGIRFLDLDTASRELVYRVVDEHLKAGGWPFDVEGGAASPLPPSVKLPSALDPVWTAPPETAVPESAAPETAAPDPASPEPAVATPGTALSSWSGREPSAPSRRWLAVAAAAAAALLAAGAWWTLRGGDRPDRAASAAPAPSRGGDAAGAGPPPAVPVPAATPAAPVLGVATAPTGESRGLGRLERITWEASPGETVVWLWGDGAVEPGSYGHTRLTGGAPRAVVKLRGVRGAPTLARLEVGTPELRRIRVGEHRVAGGDELHIVLDLAGPEARLRAIEAEGSRLRLRVGVP